MKNLCDIDVPVLCINSLDDPITPYQAIAYDDIGIILSKGNNENIEQSISVNSNLSAPIKSGEKIGNIEFYLNGDFLATCDLISRL